MCKTEPNEIFYNKKTHSIHYQKEKEFGEDIVYFFSEEEYSQFIEKTIQDKVLNKKQAILRLNGDTSSLLSQFDFFLRQHDEHQDELLTNFSFLTKNQDIISFLSYLEDYELEEVLSSAVQWMDLHRDEDILIKFKDVLQKKDFENSFQEKFFIDFILGHEEAINKKPSLSVKVENFLIDYYPTIIPIIAESIHAIKNRQSILDTDDFHLAFKEYAYAINTNINFSDILNKLHIPKWGHIDYKNFIDLYHQFLEKKNPHWKISLKLSRSKKSADVSLFLDGNNFSLKEYQQQLLFGLIYCRQHSVNMNKFTLDDIQRLMFQYQLESSLSTSQKVSQPKI